MRTAPHSAPAPVTGEMITVTMPSTVGQSVEVNVELDDEADLFGGAGTRDDAAQTKTLRLYAVTPDPNFPDLDGDGLPDNLPAPNETEGGGGEEGGGEEGPTDEPTINYEFDVDMDVDHTTPTGYPNAANGDRSEEEEAWEDSAAVFVLANQGDRDNDHVPGFADGIDLFGNGQANSCGAFSTMVVSLNVPIDEVPSARVIFRYGASNPNQLQRHWDAAGDARYSLPDNNVIRIWKKDGPSVRNPHSVQDGGDFVQPGYSYSAEELGWTGAGVFSIHFYVEVVDHTGLAGPRPMSVEFYASGNTVGGFTSADTVKIQSTIVQSGNLGSSSQ